MARTRAKTEADAAKAKDEERERKLKEQLYARERGKFAIVPGARAPGPASASRPAPAGSQGEGYSAGLIMARTRAKEKKGTGQKRRKTEADAAKAKDEERERKLNEELDALRVEEQKLASKRAKVQGQLADFREEYNEKLLCKLPLELWEKICSSLESNNLFAFALSCRFFRKRQKDLVTKDHKKKLKTEAYGYRSQLVSWRLYGSPRFGQQPKLSASYLEFVMEGALAELGTKHSRDRDYRRDRITLNVMNLCARDGHLDLLKALAAGRDNPRLPGGLAAFASEGGHLGTLKWLRQEGCTLTSEVCTRAALAGHLHVIYWARRTVKPKCPWDSMTVANAAYAGHLEILKFLRSRRPRCPWDKASARAAAEGGHLQCLIWMRSQSPPCPWDEDKVCEYAAHGGNLNVIQWARRQVPPCPWDEETCNVAADLGHLHILKWVRAQDPPCPWDEETCAGAAELGNFEMLRWLRSQDPPCPWSERTCAAAARGGQLEILQWMRSQDPPCPWDWRTYSMAHDFNTGAVYTPDASRSKEELKKAGDTLLEWLEQAGAPQPTHEDFLEAEEAELQEQMHMEMYNFYL